MAYITFSDFRVGTLAEYCYGLDLTTAEAGDSVLTAAIASAQQRIERLTGDTFESANRTYEIDVDSYSCRLDLPARVRTITTVKTRDYAGNLTTESTGAFRMHSSLDSTGTYRLDRGGDWLTVIPGNTLSVGAYWPVGPQTVQVVGQWFWAAVPAEIKRATARLTYERLKEMRGDLDRAETMAAGGVTLRFLEADNDHPTGIREVDDIIADYAYAGGTSPNVLIA